MFATTLTAASHDSHVLSSSAFHRRRPLFWLTLAACAGIFFDDTAEPSSNWILAALGASVVLSTTLMAIQAKWALVGAHAFVFLAAFLSGSTYHAQAFRIPAANDISRLTPERPTSAWLRGVIVESEWRNEDSTVVERGKLTHWIVSLNALGTRRESLAPASGTIRLTLKRPTDSTPPSSLAEGDEIECRVLIKAPEPATMPEVFDYGDYLASRGIRRVGLVDRADVFQSAPPKWWRIDLSLRRFSGRISLLTLEMFSGKAEQAGLFNAMVFGRREALSVPDRESFAISGTAHVLAISGLHIQIICLAFYRVLGLVGLPRRKAALWVLGASFLYCLLTGSSPPAVRAVAMLAAYVGAAIFWREVDPLNALAFAALICLGIAPQDLFSAGFQLSFLAVLGLLTLLPALEDAWQRWRLRRARNLILARAMQGADDRPGDVRTVSRLATFGALVRESLFISLAAWLVTAPAVAWHMGRISTLSLLANLVVVPLLSFCMFPGIAALAIGSVWPALGKLFGSFACFFITFVEQLNGFLATVPYASINSPRPIAALLLLSAALLSAIWILRDRESPLLRMLILMPATVAVIFSSALFFPRITAPELFVFNLTRGHSALFAAPGETALINCGDAGQGARIAEFLRRSGRTRLDLLVITSDEPAAIGGALEVVQAVLPSRVVLPRAKMPSETRRALERFLTARKVPHSSPGHGEKLGVSGGVEWVFFNDGPDDSLPPANSSTLFARIRSGQFSVLIAEVKSTALLERLLIKPASDFSADMLRLIPGTQSRWPKECRELMRRAGAKILIAGTQAAAEELPGLDFEALEIPTLSPAADGTVWVRWHAGGMETQTYKNGWHVLQTDTAVE